MTREQALEDALRKIVNNWNDLHSKDLHQARAALALPPDGVNAEMLAALKGALMALDGFERKDVAAEVVRAAIAKAG
jgi:hypothetical protein